MIRENLENIQKKIEAAAKKSGRSASDIMLLGVTKTIDIERIKELLSLGIKDIGENKVQELTSKYEVIGEGANWHLIGHLQTNKVKYMIDKVKMIHSVDSMKLAVEIDKKSSEKNKITNILVEVNVGGEESKFGIKPEDTVAFVQDLSRLKNVKVKGLMTVAPFVEDSEKNRESFRHMQKLFIDIKAKSIDNISMEFLSMGMSNDFEVAIEEGSNIVRVGTAIFGERDYL